jgi:hypothetical protein
MKKKKKTRFFYVFKLKSYIYLFYFINYDIYWLRISRNQYLNNNKAQLNKKL